MRTQLKWYRFAWPEKVVLPIAVIIAGGVFTLWIIGLLALVGYSHERFDSAMFCAAIKAESIVILPIWLFLRAADIGVRILGRLLRPGLRAADSVGLVPSSQSMS